MEFTETDKAKAIAICNVFETSRPQGDYTAVAVLNDGAGISYGTNQFTHKAGSLIAVLTKYLATDSQVGRAVIEASMPIVRLTTKRAIETLAANQTFKKALRAAGVTREMKEAQDEVRDDLYLDPTLRFCTKRGFTLPLSLAAVYDSINHGNFASIAARARGAEEKEWITSYLKLRDQWFASVPRLHVARVRTKFFLDQIGRGNWDLRLPVIVHGLRLTEAMLPRIKTAAVTAPAAEPNTTLAARASEVLQDSMTKFDRADVALSELAARTDRAKSLWTTVAGTFGQAMWAIFGFFAGLPPEVWLVVAIIAAALTLLYLYRQIVLGKIREEFFNAGIAKDAEAGK
ncbi:MAG: chitosanase [Acidobacteria bacterium]|nr:chitosanase [Acidobacteriota bacterium]